MANVRQHFPALAADGQEQVFFDNAGGSQVLGSVVDAIRDYLINSNVQLGATYAVGQKSTSRYENGFQSAAKYINAARNEIVLGSSTTQLFRNLSTALHFDPGDEIIISIADHEANIAPWIAMAEANGLVIKWWRPATSPAPLSPTNPKLTAEDVGKMVTSKTRLVTCTHTSNVLGSIHDVKAIAAAVHERNSKALVCVDAVAYAPHRKVDVKALGVDIYAFSWYKVYGPHMAILYANDSAQSQMKTLGHYFNKHATLEQKMGLAGASYELIAGIPAVAAYVADRWEAIYEQECKLQAKMLAYLTSKPELITVLGETSADGKLRVPTMSFRVKGWKSNELVEAVEKVSKVGFRWGSFYSNRLTEDVLSLPADGAVRVSLVHYNTVEEVDLFIKALDQVISIE